MSQTQKLINLLLDYEAHSTPEILEKVYGDSHLGIARIGARIYDAKKRGYNIKGRKDKDNPSIYWYYLVDETHSVEETSTPQEENITRATNQPTLANF